MRKLLSLPLLMLCLASLICPVVAARAADSPQEAQAFAQHCAVCHPGGKNIINPAKTLSRKSLSAKGIRDAAGIVEKMRNPGPGMTKFDEKIIPDATARAIAEYVLRTFP